MPYYLGQAAYTPQACAAMAKSPQDRLEPIRQTVESLGGKLLCMYNCFGEYDAMVITEMPDNVSTAAFSLALSAGGAVKAVKTTPLMTTQEFAEASRKAGQAAYRPPA